jgi:hypothetical protein
MPLSWLRSWVLVLGVCTCLGCGDADKDAEVTEGTAEPAAVEETAGVKVVKTDKLPKLGNALPTLDRGRISELAPPAGWEPLPRDNKHVARFSLGKSKPNDLPRMMITAEDATGFKDDVTADNVVAFAEALAAEDRKYLEPPKALVLGDNAYARYVTQAKKGSRIVERQVLETVFDGRRYAYILEVYSEHLKKHRDFAYSVAAHVQYHKPAASTPSPMPSTEAPMPPASEEKKTE